MCRGFYNYSYESKAILVTQFINFADAGFDDAVVTAGRGDVFALFQVQWAGDLSGASAFRGCIGSVGAFYPGVVFPQPVSFSGGDTLFFF